MKDNKINGYNKNKTNDNVWKKKFTPIDDDGAKMRCTLANSVLVLWESTVQVMTKWQKNSAMKWVKWCCVFECIYNV